MKETQELQRKELESLLESPNNEKQKEAKFFPRGEVLPRLRTNRCFTDVNGLKSVAQDLLFDSCFFG